MKKNSSNIFSDTCRDILGISDYMREKKFFKSFQLDYTRQQYNKYIDKSNAADKKPRFFYEIFEETVKPYMDDLAELPTKKEMGLIESNTCTLYEGHHGSPIERINMAFDHLARFNDMRSYPRVTKIDLESFEYKNTPRQTITPSGSIASNNASSEKRFTIILN